MSVDRVQMKEVCVSAPGKLILSGEHSVVHGQPALAAALDLRTSVVITPGTAGKVSLNLPDLGLSASWDTADVEKLVQAHGSTEPPADFQFHDIRKLAGVTEAESDTKSLAPVAFLHLYIEVACRPTLSAPSCEVCVRSKLPVGAGLGSSAAFSVALAAGLLESVGSISRDPHGEYSHEQKMLVNKWAFAGEKVIHGTPSGIDNSVSAYGGALHFVKGHQPVELSAVPRLRILLVNTKVPRSTMKLVGGVRERLDANRSVMEPLLTAMGQLSLAFEKVLGDLSREEAAGGECSESTVAQLEVLVDMNQHMLNAIGVGHAVLDRVCAVATSLGAHAKLTGAGGGGCAFVVLRKQTDGPTLEKLKTAIIAEGFEVWETAVGAQGVRGDKAPL